VTKIVIVGAGAQGAVVADILQRAGTPPIAFVDEALAGRTILGVPVRASLDQIEHDAVIVAIGDNAVRRRVMERLAGERFATAIHPFSSIAPSATVGEGAMICAGAIVAPRAVIGRGALLNTKSSVDHDSVLGEFVHIAPGATLGGNVRIGEQTLIGAGATVVSGRSVGARSIVGAGAVVARDIGDDVTAVGVPARVTSDRRSEEPSR
jgi:sugar O-acyltransferase (sialic acid O-acetyltransferase NeuD family)